MDVRSAMLSPVHPHPESAGFFTNRNKTRASKRHTKKWLNKLNKANDPIDVRKALTRMSKRRSMPYLHKNGSEGKN